MRNTEKLATEIYDYFREAEKINRKYDGQIEAIKRYAGSAGYDEDVRMINVKRNASLEENRKNHAEYAGGALKAMKAALDSRQTPMKAPTNEQINAVQALKLRSVLTRADIEAAADLCRDNAAAMSIVREIARTNGIHGVNYDTSDTVYPTESAARYMDNIRRSCADLFRADSLPFYLRRLANMSDETEIINKLAVYPNVIEDRGGGVKRPVTDTDGVKRLSAVLNGDE